MPDEGDGDGIRLQKVLAQAGLGSRRVCEDLIEARRVRVDGEVAVLGRRVDPEVDVIEVDGAFAGQVTLGNIQHGIVSECWIGYWVHSPFMGRGVATLACALGVDHAFARVGLHRLTATYLPDNPASGTVLEHNGFREEGYLHRNLHIDGQWRDHLTFVVTGEQLAASGPLVDRLHSRHTGHFGDTPPGSPEPA